MRTLSVNGRIVNVPENANGTVSVKTLKALVGTKGQQMVVQNRNGGNVVLPDHGDVDIAPGAFITTLMLRTRGEK